jgi:hypothetical protein
MAYVILIRLVTPIAAAIPDVVSLLEKINVCLVIWYAATDLTDFFS